MRTTHGRSGRLSRNDRRHGHQHAGAASQALARCSRSAAGRLEQRHPRHRRGADPSRRPAWCSRPSTMCRQRSRGTGARGNDQRPQQQTGGLDHVDRQPQRHHAERAVAVLFARPAHHASRFPRRRGRQSRMAWSAAPRTPTRSPPSSGAGATAPGMASGGSFMVGGGYSANDNKIAAFPVASGEEVVVNRNRTGRRRPGHPHRQPHHHQRPRRCRRLRAR